MEMNAIPGPASLYQQSRKEEKPIYQQSDKTPGRESILPDWNNLQQMMLDDDDEDLQRTQREALIRQFHIRLNMLLQPRIVIQLGESVHDKNPFEMPSPRYLQPGQQSLNTARSSSSLSYVEEVPIIEKLQNQQQVNDYQDKSPFQSARGLLPKASQSTLSQYHPSASSIQQASHSTLPKVASNVSIHSSVTSTRQCRSVVTYSPREPDETQASALTNTSISMLGGLYKKVQHHPPVQTFRDLRASGTTKKVFVALTPLKKSQIVNYFDQIRETKEWKKLVQDKDTISEFKEPSVQDLLKKLEISKSQQPRGQLFLKHLSPLHSVKSDRDADIRKFNNLVKQFGELRQFIEKEYNRLFFKEEINDITPNPKLQGRVIMKIDARHVEKEEVPAEFQEIKPPPKVFNRRGTIQKSPSKIKLIESN